MYVLSENGNYNSVYMKTMSTVALFDATITDFFEALCLNVHN